MFLLKIVLVILLSSIRVPGNNLNNLFDVIDYCGTDLEEIIEVVSYDGIGNYFIESQTVLQETMVVDVIEDIEELPEDTTTFLIVQVYENNKSVFNLVSFGLLYSASEERIFASVYRNNVMMPQEEYNDCLLVEVENSETDY